jgi:hypothetical protein
MRRRRRRRLPRPLSIRLPLSRVVLGNGVAEAGEECDGTDAAACDTPFAFSQCGAPGELDACECSSVLVQPDACPAPMSCPAGQPA